MPLETQDHAGSRTRRTCEDGQTMAEYVVVLTVISLGVIAAFALFTAQIERSILRVIPLIPG